MLWDCVVDYVRDFDKRHEQAAEFLFSPGGRYLFECLQINPQSALEAIHLKREEFKQRALMAFVDPVVYEDDLRDWWVEWYGTGFPAAV